MLATKEHLVHRGPVESNCSVRATPFGVRGVRRSEDRLLKCWPELQICITQLTREGSPPPGLLYFRQSCHGIPVR